MEINKNAIEKNLPLRTFVKLIRAAETVSSTVHSSLSEHTLTISQFGVLEALHHLGPMCQKELAGKILKSTGNITMVIDNLEKRGLVQRLRGETDRRFYTIHLTQKGASLIAEIFPAHCQRIERAMSHLSPDEQKLLGALCRKFKDTRHE